MGVPLSYQLPKQVYSQIDGCDRKFPLFRHFDSGLQSVPASTDCHSLPIGFRVFGYADAQDSVFDQSLMSWWHVVHWALEEKDVWFRLMHFVMLPTQTLCTMLDATW